MKKILYGLGIVLAVVLTQQIYEKIVPEKSVNASAEASVSMEKIFDEYSVHEVGCDIEGYYYKKLIEDTMSDIIKGEKKYSVEEDASDDFSNNLYMVTKGKIYGEISISQQEKISEKLMKELEAKKVFSSDKDNFSIYAYSDIINDYVAIGNEKINVNVAFLYDEEANATNVYIGSPIVNYDY